jgi:hypothetical protein
VQRVLFFNLTEKKYREESLTELLDLATDNDNSEEMLVLTSSMTLDAFSLILERFNLNPILLQEVASRQAYEKFVEMDENTILYNLQIE